MSKIRRQDSRFKRPKPKAENWYPCFSCEQPIGEHRSWLTLLVPGDPHVFGWLCAECGREWEEHKGRAA